MSFPASPAVGNQWSEGGRLYAWDGYAWSLVANVTGHAASHSAGGSDPLTLTSSQISNFSTAVAAASPSPLHPFLLMGG